MLTSVTVSAVVLLWLGGYALTCWRWPFTACRRCKGKARFMSPSGKFWRPCRQCKGTGQRVRTGRRIWVALRGIGS